MAATNARNDSGNGGGAGDVALLIDYENLQISLKRLFNVTTPQMSLIIQEAQERGRLVLARAYAPWTSPDLAIDAENLYRQGIEPIYVPTRKNSADVRIAVDAVETAVGSSNIATFVIVTGDGDLIHPINFLRQHGRNVVVIGVDQAMSRMLSSAADTVLLYERDLDPSVRGRRPQRASSGQGEQPKSPPPTPATTERTLVPQTGAPPIEEAFRMLRETLERRGDGAPILFQELGHWLGQDFNLKPRAWYGVPFGAFMEAAQAAGDVVVTTSGGNSYASLPSLPTISNEDDESLDDLRDEIDPGLDVRLESLRVEERRDLFEELRQLQASKKAGYLSFRTILAHLTSASVLPRLSEGQVKRLLNDLANRTPPILIRHQRRGRNAAGPFTFSAFTLTDDESLLDGEVR